MLFAYTFLTAFFICDFLYAFLIWKYVHKDDIIKLKGVRTMFEVKVKKEIGAYLKDLIEKKYI